ncbi:MAG: LamG domain-containing protein [Acidobacteria bacterium]|nr:LamG domain-containing protein [Acidobacteriota bacterium]
MPNPIVHRQAVNSRHSLFDKLIAYWPLSEPSNYRVDLIGNNTLTDNATVTQAEGIFGKAAQFTAANSEYLSSADNADLSVQDIDFTVAFWAYLDSKTVERFAVAKGDAATVNQAYSVRYHQPTDRFRFTLFDGAGAGISVNANNLGIPATATWYFIVVWHDSVANQVAIQVNDGTPNTAAFTTGSHEEAGTFFIGQRGDNANFWDGRLQAAMYWKRLLVPKEKTDVFNRGKGLPFPFNV